MGQILHGSATTTEAIRRAIQNSEESLRALSARYGINQKTVAKWRRRTSVADLPTGPKDAKSTVLTPDEEAMIVAFRRHRECPEVCVSAPVHAVSDTQAAKRSPNIMANWFRAANHSRTLRPSFSKLRIAR